jgi:hypothetical protein
MTKDLNMKPLAIVKSLLAASALLIFVSCEKEEDIVIWQPVDKTITYKIFPSKDYSDQQYADVSHTIRLSVLAIDWKTANQTVIWDTVIGPNSIQQFPQFRDTITIRRTFTMIEEVEKINAAAYVTYNKGGLVNSEGQSSDLPKGQTSLKMMVDL